MEKIIKLLIKLKIDHYECDDEYYNCPKSPEGSFDENKEGCTCGADTHNARVDEAIQEVKDQNTKRLDEITKKLNQVIVEREKLKHQIVAFEQKNALREREKEDLIILKAELIKLIGYINGLKFVISNNS